MRHFILIKQADFTREGEPINAHAAALRLLGTGQWPLWSHTAGRLLIEQGDRVAVYLAGAKNQKVIASAMVASKVNWSSIERKAYPLNLSGVPVVSLKLESIKYFTDAVSVVDHLDELSFIPANRKKWGVAMMGGMRHISAKDFNCLTGVAPETDAERSEDLRNLIYAQVQFDDRGETDLTLEKMERLVARGWMAEGHENSEYDVTDEGTEAIGSALASKELSA